MPERICMGCMEKYNDKYSICPYCGYNSESSAQEPYHLTPGTVIGGKYIVGKAIGYGGFSVTYIGYDYSIDKKVAIKEYMPSEFATRSPGSSQVVIFTGDREEQFRGGIEKFVDEAKRLAKFRGTPGVTDVYDVLVENNTAYIVMEFLEGETLKEYLEKNGKISPDEAIEMMLPIIRTLKTVNAQGILHRDIAPDNIFMTNNGEVKLIDFGAARQATSTNHSKSLSVIVKPGYAPPEQYRSRGDQGSWTDVYGCGAVLYKMITGVTPEDSMDRDAKDSLKDISKFNIDITTNQENAIMNALNLEIEDRTPDMERLEYELTTDEEVARIKAKKKKMDFGRWPLWLKISVPAAAVLLLTLGTLLVTGVINWKMFIPGATSKVRVPNVVNQTLNDAEIMIQEKDMLIQIVDQVESDTIPKGAVLSQNIPYGTEVKGGMVLEVTISGGVGQVYMPDVVGLSKEKAEQELKDLGLFVKTDTAESEIKKEYICAQQYKYGEAVDKGSEVNLTVSLGKKEYDNSKKTEVPNVVGEKWDDARKMASDKRIYIYKSDIKNSDTVEKDIVMKQSLKAKSKVEEGSDLGVDVSLGINTTHVPDVIYKSFDEASKLMNDSKIKIEVTYQKSDVVAKDHVISQSVEAGTEVKVWSTVSLCISVGSDKIDAAPRYEDTDKKNTTSEQTKTTEKTTEKKSESKKEDKNTEDKKTEHATEEQRTENKTETTTENVKPSKDDSMVDVPSLVGMSLQQAEAMLESNELSVGSVEYRSSSSSSTGIVLDQGIGSNQKVKKGTQISLIVCSNDTVTMYRYRDVQDYDIKKTNSNSTPSGYTYYKTEESQSYGNWGGWTEWSSNYVQSSDTCNVEAKDGAVFGRYDTYRADGSYERTDDKWQNSGSRSSEYYLPCDEVTRANQFQWPGSSTERWVFNSNGEVNYRNVSGTGEWSWTGTVYRYQTRSVNKVYTYWYRKPIYGSWSEWSTSRVSESSTRQVETKQDYVYEQY